MNRFKRYRPSPAMIVAIIALVLSLGGTSYAAIVLPAGSVGTKQLKANAVIGSKVKNGSLSTADISSASLSKLGRIAIANGSVAGVNTGTDATTRIAVVSLRCPTKGFVLVNGWVDMAGGTGGTWTVRVWDDAAGTHSPFFNGGTPAGAEEQSLGNTAVFPVTAGTRNFSVRVDYNLNGAFSAWGTVTAQFIPYNGVGTKTAIQNHSVNRVAPQPMR